MKKTIIDISYYTFSSKSSDQVLSSCYSTLGYLYKITSQFRTFFVTRTTESMENRKIENVSIFLYKGLKLKKWQIPFKFNNYIKSFNPDYILVHGFGFIHYLVFLKLILPKSKIVLQCNGYAFKPKGFKRLVYKLSDKFIDGYLFTGIENAKHWYDSNILKKEKVFEVMEGSTYFNYNPEVKRKPNSFVWVGGLNNNKDPLTVLKAFLNFLKIQPLAKLIMVFHQNDLLADLEMFINKNPKLNKAVNLKGYVKPDFIEEIYNQTQFFILGSHYEGSGYALLESMACGCVPIVTNIPSFKFMTNNGDCAFLFSSGNSDELFKQLKATQNCDYELLQDKVLKQFKNKLSSEAIAKEIYNVFDSLESKKQE